MSTNILFAQVVDDNEIKITQTGDTLKLYIDQVILVTRSAEIMHLQQPRKCHGNYRFFIRV